MICGCTLAFRREGQAEPCSLCTLVAAAGVEALYRELLQFPLAGQVVLPDPSILAFCFPLSLTQNPEPSSNSPAQSLNPKPPRACTIPNPKPLATPPPQKKKKQQKRHTEPSNPKARHQPGPSLKGALKGSLKGSLKRKPSNVALKGALKWVL